MYVVVAQPCKKYHIFYYTNVGALEMKTMYYTTAVVSEHPTLVDIVLQLGQVGEPCVSGDTYLYFV